MSETDRSACGEYRPYANRLSEPAAEELRLGAVFHQVGLDEGIQVAVHHRLDSRSLHARAMVFHTPVVEDIGADQLAASFFLLTLLLLQALLQAVHLSFQKAYPQSLLHPFLLDALMPELLPADLI